MFIVNGHPYETLTAAREAADALEQRGMEVVFDYKEKAPCS